MQFYTGHREYPIRTFWSRVEGEIVQKTAVKKRSFLCAETLRGPHERDGVKNRPDGKPTGLWEIKKAQQERFSFLECPFHINTGKECVIGTGIIVVTARKEVVHEELGSKVLAALVGQKAGQHMTTETAAA